VLVRRASRVSKAICPGSFDPITLGHVDIIERAAKTFDEVVVAVAINETKQPLFDREARVRMIREACAHLKNVSADSFCGLMVDYAEAQGARVIVKGLRAVSDFESELQMALMNRNLNANVETLFVMTSAEHSFLSSRIVKEIAGFGGDVSKLVPPNVVPVLLKKLGRGKGGCPADANE